MKTVLISGLIVLFVTVCLRGVLINPNLIGHNWDFTFPYVNSLFYRLPVVSTFTWWNNDLGTPLSLTIAQLGPNALLAGLGHVLGAVWAVKVLIVSVVLVAIVGFGKLLSYLLANMRPSEKILSAVKNEAEEDPLLGKYWILPFAVLYGLSPFLFNDIIGGSWYMWVSYAAIPFWLMGIMTLVREGLKNKWLLYWLLASIFVISSLQNFVLIESLIFLYLLWEAGVRHRLKLYFLRYFMTHLILLAVNLYWVLPFIANLKGFSSSVFNNNFSDNFLHVKSTTQSLLNITNLGGYLNRNIYFYSLPEFFRPLVVAVSALGLGLMVLMLIKLKNLKPVLPWLVIFFVSLLVVKGATQPWGGVAMWWFSVVPLMNLYRSPQHLMLVPALFIPLLAAFAYHLIQQENTAKLKSENKVGKVFAKYINRLDLVKLKPYLLTGWIVMVLIWLSGWWLSGDLGQKTLLEQKRDHVDFYRLPPDLVATYELSESDPIAHRILFLPALHSPVYLPTEYQSLAQGGQPEHSYLKNPTFNEETVNLAKLINEHFCGLRDLNWLNLAVMTNSKYVAIRNDIYPVFSSCKNDWKIASVFQEVDGESQLTQLIDGKHTKTYQLADELFLPRIYAADRMIYTTRSEEDIGDLVSEKDFDIKSAVYFESNQNERVENMSLPTLTVKQISPVKYRLLVTGAKDEFPLIFSENYHPQWKAYLASMSQEERKLLESGTISGEQLARDNFSETWFKHSLDEAAHQKVNSYANSWIVDPVKLCSQNLSLCVSNETGSYDFELIIEFWPQRLFYVGLMIALIALTMSIFYVLVYPKFTAK